jgi:hypothetical protein
MIAAAEVLDLSEFLLEIVIVDAIVKIREAIYEQDLVHSLINRIVGLLHISIIVRLR